MSYHRVALFLCVLAPAIAGCRAVPRVQTPDAPHTARVGSSHVSERDSETAGEQRIALASFDQPKPPTGLDLPGDKTPLTLADLEAIAREHNPTLAAAEARSMMARGQRVQAGLYPNPVIGYHATEVGNLGTAGQQGAFISQRFITAGKLRLDEAVARQDVERAQFLFDAQQLRVLNDVRVRFHDALVAQRRLALTKELAKNGDDLVAASQKLLKGRQISENDLLQAEIEAEQSHILHDNAGNENVETWRRLATVIGVPTKEHTPLDGDLAQRHTPYQWEECRATLLGSSPELSAARTRVRQAGIAIERSRRENVPNVDLSISVRHHNVTGSDVANVQLGFPLPIFDRNQGNILRAHGALIAARNDVRRIELNLEDRLAVAFRQYDDARQQADRYKRRILTRARKSLDLVTNAYEKGQMNYVTLITARQTFVRVNLAYLDALREYHRAVTAIDGLLLGGSLSQQ